MSEDTTKELANEVSFETRVLSELAAIRADQSETRKEIAALGARVTAIESHVTAIDERVTAINERLTSLEEKVDARLRETRPIWEAVLEKIRLLDSKFNEVIKDLYEVRADYSSYEKRLSQFEERLSRLENVR